VPDDPIQWQLVCRFDPTVSSWPLLQFAINHVLSALEDSPVKFTARVEAVREGDEWPGETEGG
jgi:hypothetical protein